MAVLEIKWKGPILDCSGYAAAGRGYLLAADTVGIKVKVFDKSRSISLYNKGIDKDTITLYERLRETHVAGNCPLVQHQVPDQFYYDKKTKKRIGYTIFEMTGVPRTWIDGCNQMDVIWTGSSYSKSAFIASGCKCPVFVLPHALNMTNFNDKADPWPVKNKAGFNFISVFDFTERKEWKSLLRAYWTAFKPSEDVCLILKVYFGGFSDEATKSIVHRISKFKEECKLTKTPRILLYGHDVPQNQMAGLYRSADCYVGISREGFGLPYAEAMACGLACIGPEVGGTREFMTKDNSYLIRYIGDENVGPETSRMYPMFANLRWAVHSWEHLSELMRQTVYAEEERKRIAKKGMEDVSRSLSPTVIGRRMSQLLEDEHGQQTLPASVLYERPMSKDNAP
jgi:glycosyltransferase involved in cell wall biosynthesis